MNFPNMKYYGGPDQTENIDAEVEMRDCDVCGFPVPEFSMKHYREAGMMVCQDCVPQCDKDEAEGIEEENKKP